MMRQKLVIGWSVVIAQAAAPGAEAACVAVADTIVEGRFVRCEDAKVYLESSGAFEGARDATSILPIGDEARVAVVLVSSHLSISPWRPGTSDTVELVSEQQEYSEFVRYWWNGPIEACETMDGGEPVELWIRPDCCDTIPGSPACQAAMRLAAPIPADLRAALSKALADR